MKSFLSKRRFESAALAVALALAIVHLWVEKTPVSGAGSMLEEGEEAGAADTFLRGIHLLEARLTDLQFRVRGPRAPNPNVLVAEVDEKSVKRYGLWPWSRAVMAKAITQLHQGGAKAVGLDITFTDETPDARGEAIRAALAALDDVSQSAQPQAQATLATYRERVTGLIGESPDARLAQALAAAPNVVQGVFLYGPRDLESLGDKTKEHAELVAPHLLRELAGPTPGSALEGTDVMGVPMWQMYSAQTPLRPFATASKRLGFINVVPDTDGTIRRIPVFTKLEGPRGILSSLEIQTAAEFFGSDVEAVYDKNVDRVVGARLRNAEGKPFMVPIPYSEPYTLVNHLGPRDVFKTVSLADVVDGALSPDEVKGKAVIVGVSLVGNYDQRVTPFSEYEPGVFIHASFLSNILDQEFLTRPADLVMVELAFLFGAALLIGFVLPRVRFTWKLVTIALAGGAWMLFDQAMFERGLQFATLIPMANVLVTSFAVIFLGYLFADTERQKLSEAFKYRVGPKVMEEMLAHPEKFKQGGERKELSVLFSDIRGFTSIAERMSPDDLSKFINEYLTPMTDIVFETDGTLDKYIGDAVMAFWGAPVDQTDHAHRACTAALRMLERLEVLKKEWRAKGRPDFDIGVGINSGPMSVGFMGSKVRGDYTVMGDAVNLASRLEGTNKEYETRILVSEGTWAQVKDQFVLRRLGAVRVKGKRRPVRIFELRGFGAPQGNDAEAVTLFDQALDLYAERKFEEAEQKLRRVLELWPDDPPAQRYIEEIAIFKVNPPGPGWDGIYTATTK